MTMNQHHRVRDQLYCVACEKDTKPIGLVLCWPCHHAQKRANDGGYSAEIERKLDVLERSLQRDDP